MHRCLRGLDAPEARHCILTVLCFVADLIINVWIYSLTRFSSFSTLRSCRRRKCAMRRWLCSAVRPWMRKEFSSRRDSHSERSCSTSRSSTGTGQNNNIICKTGCSNSFSKGINMIENVTNK